MSHHMETLGSETVKPFIFPDVSRTKTTRSKTKKQIIYPDSDGKPMADNTLQFDWIMKIKDNLDMMFSDRPDVFVAGDLLWYPVKDNVKERAAPDAMVVFGRPKGYRGSYIQCKEDNIAPHVVFEILSPGNKSYEMRKKLDFYDKYGVEEYYLYDPYKIIFKGWRRVGKKLKSIEIIKEWISPKLKIRFEVTETVLNIYAPDGERFKIPWKRSKKERQQTEQEKQRAEKEKQRADMLEAKLRELGIDL